MTIDVYDNQDEDIKKHFRRTNRFIIEVIISPQCNLLFKALENQGKIFIHGWEGLSAASSFALAFMISHKKMPLKMGMKMIRRLYYDIHMNEYF